MKLEVGKWCRTKEGTIFKIIGGNVDMWEIDIDYSYLSKCENEDYNSYAYNKNNSLFEDLVIKASYNIIDILEVGDVIEIDVIDEDNYPTIMGINFARIDNKVELASIKDMLKNESAKLLTVTTHEQMKKRHIRWWSKDE